MRTKRGRVSFWSRKLNAGLIVIFGSSHPPLFQWDDWTRRCRCLPEEQLDEVVSAQAVQVEELFFARMGVFLTRTLGESELTPVEKQYWIQSGLALSPLMATCTQYSLDLCLAWALIGEWTSRILFPVPKGSWPRHGHAGKLLPEYQARSPRIVAWARACFEEGALPSLLLLQGLVPIFTLPGDKMFQSTGVQQGRHRPPVIHAYGGAKVGMAQALRSIAVEGWVPLAAAMVGTKGKKPMWADLGLRPVIGTTVDIKVMPQALEDREVDLLLSCWKKWDYKSVTQGALNQWLNEVDIEWGPECVDSPHFRRINIDCFETVKLLEESGFGFLPEVDLQNQPTMEAVMSVGLRLCALEFTSEQLKVLAYLSVSGVLPESFPHSRWVMAVFRSFCTQEAAICTCGAEWEEVRRILEQIRTADVTLESAHGTTLWTRDSVCFPEPQADEFPLRLLVHPETRDQTHLPELGWGAEILVTRRGGICLYVVTQKASTRMARPSPMSKT